ncbi:hypothetical protein NQ318_009831 [Aromia moschata]|uniref:RNA-directed DNA polymerase n=1 Tax=Aromia moschata TaxID=1265417 RepID=A0AAV8XQ07_9CUCU|nr:hypothetical protein NQ318_009831 [Aromia moschata]
MKEVLQEVHGGVGGGHFGISKTLNKVRERFYRLGSRVNVEDWCRQCTDCSSSKGPKTRIRADLRFGYPEDRVETIEDYSYKLAARLDSIHDEVRKKMTFESNRSKNRYDARANTEGFHEDDEVWLYNPARKKERCPKLQKSWEGPYKIIKRLKDVVYMIQRGPRAKMKVVHLDRLTPYSRADEQ